MAKVIDMLKIEYNGTLYDDFKDTNIFFSRRKLINPDAITYKFTKHDIIFRAIILNIRLTKKAKIIKNFCRLLTISDSVVIILYKIITPKPINNNPKYLNIIIIFQVKLII